MKTFSVSARGPHANGRKRLPGRAVRARAALVRQVVCDQSGDAAMLAWEVKSALSAHRLESRFHMHFVHAHEVGQRTSRRCPVAACRLGLEGLALLCIAMPCFALHCIALVCTVLHCLSSLRIAMKCFALHCIDLHCCLCIAPRCLDDAACTT